MVTTPTEWKGEIKVNTDDSNAQGEDQRNPVVVGLTNGNILVVWQSDATTSGDGFNIKAQLYDFQRNPIGGEFQLNQSWFFDDQTMPEITATTGGGFVVVYQDDVDGLGTFDILADRYDSAGSLVSNRSIATSVDEETSPTVTAFSDGSYLVAYEDDASGSSNINAVIVSAGDVVGVEFSIANDADNETSPTAATLSNDNAVVVYLDPNAGDTTDVRVIYEIYDSTGSVVRGESIASANALVNREPHVAALAGGGFVIVWTDPGIDGNSDGIAAAVYDNAGNEVVAPFQVNNNTGGSQNEPRVAALADGGFVIVWDDDNSDLIRGQRYDAAGAEVGNQFSMDNISETSPDIAGLTDGRFIVAYERVNGSNSDIFAQIWDPRETTITGTISADAIAGRIEASSISGSFGNDTLAGQSGDDTISGSFGNDLIYGGGGNDSVLGSFDNDTIFGDAGDDILEGNDGDDSIEGGTGNDSLLGGAGLDYLNGGGANDTVYGGDDNDTIDGDTGDDQLRGEAGDDSIIGGGGMDTLYGREGNDTLDGGIDADRAYGGGGDDSILGGNGADSLSGQGGNDTIDGGAADDVIWGRDGADFLDGKGGHDSLLGGGGNDTLLGGLGDDTLRGIGENDFIYGDNGHDYITGGTGDDFLLGGDGSDSIQGNAGNDTLSGADFGTGNGYDTLNGGSGDDLLFGSNQDDTLTGGPGDDTFLFQLGDDADTITDFVAGGTDDQINLQGFGTDFDTFTEVLDAAVQDGANVVITFNGTDSITLLGTDKGDLTVDDFIFS